jgi:hypothetical protein
VKLGAARWLIPDVPVIITGSRCRSTGPISSTGGGAWPSSTTPSCGAPTTFFGATLATSLGLASPKTLLLPNKEYIPGIVHTESLRNLEFPLDWKAVVDYVGLPCILKDAYGGGWKGVYICHSLEELLHHYDRSGLLTMIVQEFIQWDEFVRCLCLGQEFSDQVRPRARRTIRARLLPPTVMQRVIDNSRTLVRALGYDMNSMEWAIKDGVPYAIDFMNPAPDMDVYSLTPVHFEWVVTQMADCASGWRSSRQPAHASWQGFRRAAPPKPGRSQARRQHARRQKA